MNEFLDKFNIDDQKVLTTFFDELNSSISLSKRERKLFNDDFEKAILYYYNNGKKVDEILKILSLDKLGNCYKEAPKNWYPLDNSAKIYPLSMKENWMSVYRLSYYLKADVVPEILAVALTFVMKRFPTFRTSIRKGFFWHYIDGIKKKFNVYEDKRLPCSYINVSTLEKSSFKVVYYKNRISLECFHILCDGYGASVFLSTLVGEYLTLLDHSITKNDFVLDIEDKPTIEEARDEFITKEKERKTKGLVENRAVEIDGKLSNVRPCQLLHFDMNVDEVKKIAKSKNVTITELMLGLIFMVSSYSTSKNGDIKVQVPVNMRKYYPSRTLRNFALYIVITIKKSDISTLDEVLLEIKKQMKEKNTKEALNETMTYANKLVSSLKLIPLFIKRPIANAIYGYMGDKASTTVLSNLGTIEIPSEMKEYVEKMDFTLGTAISNRVLFSMITCNETLTLSISKFTLNTSVENNLYNLLKQNDIEVKVHGSEVYENRK